MIDEDAKNHFVTNSILNNASNGALNGGGLDSKQWMLGRLHAGYEGHKMVILFQLVPECEHSEGVIITHVRKRDHLGVELQYYPRPKGTIGGDTAVLPAS